MSPIQDEKIHQSLFELLSACCCQMALIALIMVLGIFSPCFRNAAQSRKSNWMFRIFRMPSFNCALISGLPMFDTCGECGCAASYRTENIIHIIVSQPQICYKRTRFSKKSPHETSNSLNMDKENGTFHPSNSLFLDKHRWEPHNDQP